MRGSHGAGAQLYCSRVWSRLLPDFIAATVAVACLHQCLSRRLKHVGSFRKTGQTCGAVEVAGGYGLLLHLHELVNLAAGRLRLLFACAPLQAHGTGHFACGANRLAPCGHESVGGGAGEIWSRLQRPALRGCFRDCPLALFHFLLFWGTCMVDSPCGLINF